MGLMIANKGIYTHSHISIEGKIYTHAHPYNKASDSNPYKSHHHSRTDLLFYQHIDSLFFTVFVIALLTLVLRQIGSEYFIEELYVTSFTSTFSGRAPPHL